MKRLLFIASLIAITIWIAGTFFLSAGRFIHFFLVLSILLYIRSLMAPSSAKWKQIFIGSKINE